MTFGEQLKAERKRLGITRAKAAELLKDVSESWIDKAESGKREPHVWMQQEALRRLERIRKD